MALAEKDVTIKRLVVILMSFYSAQLLLHLYLAKIFTRNFFLLRLKYIDMKMQELNLQSIINFIFLIKLPIL